MKNLFTYSVVIGILSILISSCGSISVTKRQFNKGYSISYNKKMKSTDSPKESESIALKTEKPTAIPNKKRGENIRSAEIVPTRESESIETAEIQEEIIPQSSPTSGEIRDNIIEDDGSSKQASNEQIQSSSDQDQVSSTTPAHEGDLSWFWIIILIVLLLWALGFIFNIGALVHLLLVVALILLILWLLGII